MPTHVLYIDDSGTKEYAERPEEYDRQKRGKSRYFVFCGALLTMAATSRLSSELVRLKIECFGEETVEIKSNWIRQPHERRQRYLAPYSLTEARLNQFVEDLYEVVNKTELVFIAAIVDKLHMQEQYAPNPWYAPAVAYELVLQRVQNDLKPDESVAVIIDDMTGATPKGNQYKANLKAQHLLLKQYGGKLMGGFKFPCLTSLKFVNSASSQVVQVADLAAYNVHRQFVDYGEQWEQSGLKTLSTYAHFDKISSKFRQDENGRVQGYGIVKFPLRTRVHWTVKPD